MVARNSAAATVIGLLAALVMACMSRASSYPSENDIAKDLGRWVRKAGCERCSVEEVTLPIASDPVLSVFLRYDAGPGCQASMFGSLMCLRTYHSDMGPDFAFLKKTRDTVSRLTALRDEDVALTLEIGRCMHVLFMDGHEGELKITCKGRHLIEGIPDASIRRKCGGTNINACLIDYVGTTVGKYFAGGSAKTIKSDPHGVDLEITLRPDQAQILSRKWERYRVAVVVFVDNGKRAIVLHVHGEYSGEGKDGPRAPRSMEPEHATALDALGEALKKKLSEGLL
jgi:hypothetical protein